VLEKAGASAAEVKEFAHGTTAATNALLEGRGARTVLVATKGFEDVVELARQNRADLYRLCRRPPGAAGGARAAGGRRRADDAGRPAARARRARHARRRRELEPESVAVCLLHAYRHPQHEQALGEALQRLVSTSRSRTRSSARSASTSARRRPSSTPRSLPCSPTICAT
jgi:N-methylhydantoinase A